MSDRGTLQVNDWGHGTAIPMYRIGMYLDILGSESSETVRDVKIDRAPNTPWATLHWRSARWYDRAWLWLRGWS